MAPAADLDALYAQLRRRMIETGELDRIMFVLSSRLNEAGWIDELKDHSKENARNMESLVFQPLFDDTLAHAHKSITSQTEKEIKSVIRQYLELQFE
ncbi:hypothetical protein JOM56_004851 [Amanita muscaria]|uniref:Transcription and mRNA export factor SUS1 n=1 Tax=Amanita muscaria (strain Koide BX008) TaxID=946122 RepID=A0A0C2SWX9_AMAMK|nr:hypothetical protein M378DRAFT_170359 [Amanita muscaria Koide BX008]